DLVGHVAVHRRQLLRVPVLLVEPAVAIEPSRDTRMLGAHLCGVLLVVPEPGLPHLLLELGDAGCQTIRVKGNHGPTRAGPRSPRAAGRAAVPRRRPWS